MGQDPRPGSGMPGDTPVLDAAGGGLRAGLVVRLARRVPFTVALIAAVLFASSSVGLLGRPIAADELAHWGFGWSDLMHGDLWRLLTAPFLILKPYMALTISAILMFFVGSCELLLRTRRTIVVFVLAHVAGYIGALLLLNLLGHWGWTAAAALAVNRDVGASNGAFGAAGAMLVFLPRTLRNAGFFLIAAYLFGALVVEQQLWDVQHSLAFLTGTALGVAFLRRDERQLSGLRLGGDVLHRQRPRLMSWLVGGMGLVNLLAAVLLPRHAGFERLEALLPIGLRHGPRMLLLFSGLLLLTVAGALRRAQRRAWWLAFLLLLLTFVLQLELGVTKLEAVFALAFLLMMVAWKEDFPAPSDAPSMHAAFVYGAIVVCGVPLAGWFATFAMRAHFVPIDDAAGAGLDVLRRIVYLAPLRLQPLSRQGDWVLEAIPLAFWSGALAVISTALRAARAPQPERIEREAARRLVLEYGRSGTAFMVPWKGNSLYFAREDRVVLAYRVHAGVAVALGDPVGPSHQRGPALHEFTRYCVEQGWSPVVLAATDAGRESYADCGYSLLKIGEEAVLDLGHLEFRGKQWQNMRSALNRARKQGIEFRMFEGGRVPPVLEAQMHDIERDWQQQLELPPMEFTLGRVDDVRDPAIEIAVAVDASGRVHGYVDWLPIPAERGWVIDLMRRRPDAMSGTMEFLIGMSLLAFQQRGDRIASLATAPLADLDRGDDPSLVPQLLRVVFERFETFYDFRSLFDFKDRFEPRWEPVYLAYRDAAELPAIALAILRAHLPHLGWGQATLLLGEAFVARLHPRGPARERATPGATGPGSAADEDG